MPIESNTSTSHRRSGVLGGVERPQARGQHPQSKENTDSAQEPRADRDAVPDRPDHSEALPSRGGYHTLRPYCFAEVPLQAGLSPGANSTLGLFHKPANHLKISAGSVAQRGSTKGKSESRSSAIGGCPSCPHFSCVPLFSAEPS